MAADLKDSAGCGCVAGYAAAKAFPEGGWLSRVMHPLQMGLLDSPLLEYPQTITFSLP